MLRTPTLVLRAPTLVIHSPALVFRTPALVLRDPTLVLRTPTLVLRAPTLVIHSPALDLRTRKGCTALPSVTVIAGGIGSFNHYIQQLGTIIPRTRNPEITTSL